MPRLRIVGTHITFRGKDGLPKERMKRSGVVGIG